MKIKRWMVITGVLSLLAGSIALASCQSTASSGTITCTMEDCEGCDADNCTGDITTEKGCSQNCSGITYNCNGTDMNCSQFMCYGNVYNCWNQEDCNDCSYNCSGCIGDCTYNCVQDNCQTTPDNNGPTNDGVIGETDCSGKSYVTRTLEENVDYEITEALTIFQRETSPSSLNNAYNLYLTFRFNIALNIICKDIEVEYILYTYDADYNRVNYETVKVTYDTREDFLNARASEEISVKNIPDSYHHGSFLLSIGKITASVFE